MSTEWFPPTHSLKRIESLTVGRFATAYGDVVAVEVFDDPRVLRWNRRLNVTTGPWLIGPADEVLSELAARGCSDYDIVIRAINPRNRQEIREAVSELTE